MKKITLSIIAAITLLASCRKHCPTNPEPEKIKVTLTVSVGKGLQNVNGTWKEFWATSIIADSTMPVDVYIKIKWDVYSGPLSIPPTPPTFQYHEQWLATYEKNTPGLQKRRTSLLTPGFGTNSSDENVTVVEAVCSDPKYTFVF